MEQEWTNYEADEARSRKQELEEAETSRSKKQKPDEAGRRH